MRKLENFSEVCPYCDYNHSEEPKNSHTLRPDCTFLHKKRYLLGAVIGEGGFGITYAAFDRTTNQPVAIKEYFPRITREHDEITCRHEENICERDANLDKNVIVNPTYEKIYQFGLEKFLKEAQTLGSLEDVKNVVPVIDYFEANNTAYIVMKFIHGITLQDYVAEKKIPPKKILGMMKEYKPDAFIAGP